MNIGIVGYSGFIGSEVYHNLTTECIDIFNCSKIDYHLFDKSPIIDLKDYDVVICCAGLAHDIDNYSYNSLPKYLSINYIGLCNLIRSCKNSNVKRFIYISSVNVSDNISSSYVKRIDNNSICKWLVENYLEKELSNSLTDFVVIRSPLVYGKGVKGSFLSLMNFVSKSFLLPFGSLNQNRRSLVSIYNLIDLIKTCISHPDAVNDFFFVSDDFDLSTSEIVAMMAKVQGTNYKLLFIPVIVFKLFGKLTNKSDMISKLTDSLEIDITYTKESLDWSPPYSVE